MDEYWEEDDRRKRRQEEIRNSTYRQYWGRRKVWIAGDGLVSLLAGAQLGSHHGVAAGALGAIVVFICLEAIWGALFYIGRGLLRRSRP